MEAESLLVQKAVDTIWQNPRLDHNLIVQLTRVSPKNGYNDYGKIGWEVLPTPTTDGQYHYYQLGDNYPGDFSLIFFKYQWVKLSDWCKTINLIVRLYNSKGEMYPLEEAFVIRMYNENLIIGVKRDNKIFELNDDILYANFYLNRFYYGPMDDHLDYRIGSFFNKFDKRKSPIIDLVTQLKATGSNLVGKVQTFRNGYLVEGIELNLNEGDVTEVRYDCSIRSTFDIPITDLRTYHSTLDLKNKYLLHPPKDGSMIIDYRDDIDIFICKDLGDGKYKGLYYHRNEEDAVRMVTHRDYGLPVPYVMNFIEALDPNPDLSKFFIKLYIRDNQKESPIIEDSNMINALYVLSNDKIVEAMVAADSTIPEWQAKNLETSYFTSLMRARLSDITADFALNAFGYNSSVKYLANPYISITPDSLGGYFTIPDGMRKLCTIFEYNMQGLLVNVVEYSGDAKYRTKTPDVVFLEVMSGVGRKSLNIHKGGETFTMDKHASYRFYIANTQGDTIISPFVDVTNGYRPNGEKIEIDIVGDQCTFKPREIGEIGYAIADNQFIMLPLEQWGSTDTVYFNFKNEGILFCPGKIEVWLNGFYLVEGIDYTLDFPHLCITTKQYMVDAKHEQEGTKNQILIVGRGFPVSDAKGNLTRILPLETGYTQYGKVSVNNGYHVHANKIIKTSVEGRIFDPSVIPYQEDGSLNIGEYIIDGRPYSVTNPVISFQGSQDISLFEALQKEVDLTKRVDDYLNVNVALDGYKLPPVIENKYSLYSPFLNTIIRDLTSGILKSTLPNVSKQILDKTIFKYKYLLKFDPAITGADDKFVTIHPHLSKFFIELTPRDYAFVKRLNKEYLDDKIDIEKFLRVRAR